MKKHLLLLAVLMLFGCASTTTVIENSAQSSPVVVQKAETPTDASYELVMNEPLEKLPLNTKGYIASANDGYDDFHFYEGSGLSVNRVLDQLFQPFFKTLWVSSTQRSARDEYIQAKTHGYDYFILPRISQWTQSQTWLTGVPNRVTLRVKIYDLHTDQLIDFFTIRSKGSSIVNTGSPDQMLLTQLEPKIHLLFFTNNKLPHQPGREI